MSTNEELQAELAELRDEVRRLRVQLTPEPPAPMGVMSRRNLLRMAPVAAVGASIAALSTSPAVAAAGQPLLLGNANDAGAATTSLASTNAGATLHVDGLLQMSSLEIPSVSIEDSQLVANPDDGFVIQGQLNPPAALSVNGVVEYGGEEIVGGDAVHIGGLGPGVGLTVDWADLGQNYPPPNSDGAAVLLTTATCDVIDVTTQAGHVLKASVTSKTCVIDAVTVSYAGTARAFFAESTTATNINGTVTGVNDGNGIGVWGEQRGTGAGFGLVGVGGKAGRGGRFSGGAAGLQILPGTTGTHPITGKAGDFFVDSSARLWYCQKASTGSTAATWKQLA